MIMHQLRENNIIYLEGNAKVAYQKMTLEAAKILINQDKRTLYAEGVSDTTDSLGNPIYTGTPVFTEVGQEPMNGNTLHYNFYTQRGKNEQDQRYTKDPHIPVRKNRKRGNYNGVQFINSECAEEKDYPAK